MSTSPVLILRPPPPVGFQIADGRTLIVAPATRARLRAVAAVKGTAESGGLTHRARVLLALTGPLVRVLAPGAEDAAPAQSADVLTRLSPPEQMAMLSALVGQAAGLEPAACAAFQRALPSEQFTGPASGKEKEQK